MDTSKQDTSGKPPAVEQKDLPGQEPDIAGTLHHLGVIAHRSGDLPQAIHFLARAVACSDANAGHWVDLGVLQTLAGNLDEAVTAFKQALVLGPGNFEVHNNLGVIWHGQGDLERACGCYRQAIQCNPYHAEAYNNLGIALNSLGHREEAVAAHEQALRLNPNFAEAFNSLGLVLHALGELPRAIACFRQALQLQPAHADASGNLATVLKDQGSLDEALAHYRETLRLHPDHPLTYYHLSQFAGEGWYHFEADELERLKDHVTAGRGSAWDRSLFCFVLGAVLDKQGCTDEAFGYFRQANDLKRHSVQQRQRAFDPAQHQAFVDRVMASFDESYFRRTRGWGLDTDLPVFIVGMPRTGSTLVEQILSSHPSVFGAGETGDIARLMAQLAQQGGNLEPGPQLSSVSDAAMAHDLAAGFLERLVRVGGNAARVTVKTLDNFLYLGVIATLFPRARIIHCRRDPLDIGLSCYFQNFHNVNFAWSQEDIGACYRQYERLMAHWRRVLPLSIHDVHYEELVHNQEAVTRDLLGFCGLSWDNRCLEFYNNRRPVLTASTLQVRRPLSTQSIGRWKRYRTHLEPLAKALDLPMTEP